MYSYTIDISGVNFVANLIVSDGKIVWEEDENSVIFRKRLDGKFSLNRSGNEPVFDKLLALTFCEQGILNVNDNTGLVIQGSFRKKHITISEDKCRIDIKFDKVDEYSDLDTIMDKDINVLTLPIPVVTAISTNLPLIEYFHSSGWAYSDSYWVGYGGHGWMGDGCTNPIIPYPSGSAPSSTLWAGWNSYQEENQWTFQQNYYTFVSEEPGLGNKFNITSFYSRQVIYVTRLGDEQSAAPSNDGDACDKYQWVFDSYNELTKQDKFARKMEITSYVVNPSVASMDKYSMIMYTGFYQTGCYAETYRYTRCRKLNDVIKSLISPFFSDFSSEFFKNTINPISGKDLTNLLISQKSDCIGTSSDPATKGIITLKSLLDILKTMFNVYWAIDENGNFRIEHKKYWDNNGSYTVSNTVDIDLSVVYPLSLIGTKEYNFEENIPIREKFNFTESWRIDFINSEIDYSNCITNGPSVEYNISQITTDIDPYLLLAYASKDGFCIFHCDSVPNTDGSYDVITDVGEMSQLILENVHISTANLLYNYWKYDRFLPQGMMNAKLTDFSVRALKYQIPISFPYCISEFNPQKLIATNLGDGAVKTASFSFRTNFITVELKYIDNI